MTDRLTWFGGQIFVKADAIEFVTTASNITPRIHYEYPMTKQQLILLRDSLNQKIGEITK